MQVIPVTLSYQLRLADAVAQSVLSKREAIKWAREEANAIIEQAERQAKGYDQGKYRDDDVVRGQSIRYTVALHSCSAFALSARFRA